MGNIQIIAVHDAIMGPIYAAAAVRLENIFNRVMRQKAPIALCVPPMSFFCVCCSRSSRKAPVLLLLLCCWRIPFLLIAFLILFQFLFFPSCGRSSCKLGKGAREDITKPQELLMPSRFHPLFFFLSTPMRSSASHSRI
jgi:hypothetical protein